MNITELSIRRPVTTIMLFVSMVVIGLIGFALDRLMLMLQRRVSWDKSADLR